jgi:hypothetical protein
MICINILWLNPACKYHVWVPCERRLTNNLVTYLQDMCRLNWKGPPFVLITQLEQQIWTAAQKFFFPLTDQDVISFTFCLFCFGGRKHISFKSTPSCACIKLFLCQCEDFYKSTTGADRWFRHHRIGTLISLPPFRTHATSPLFQSTVISIINTPSQGSFFWLQSPFS